MKFFQMLGSLLGKVFTPTVDAELEKVAETVVVADLEKVGAPKAVSAPAPKAK
jgi:hypothetical protein